MAFRAKLYCGLIAGVLIGVLGVVVILGLGGALSARPGLLPDSVTLAGPLARTARERLRLARGQLGESLGPLGAFVMLLGGCLLVVTVSAVVLGFAVALLEHPLDWWAFHQSDRMRDDGWAGIMRVITRMGNLPATRVTGLVASFLLAFAARGRRWAPALIILGVIVVEKYQQSMIGTIVDRGHPPTTLGTFPSGDCARLIGIYGAVIFVTLELARAGRRTRVMA